MKRVPKYAKAYILILTFVAVALLIWSISQLQIDRKVPQDVLVSFILLSLVAIGAEIASIEMPRYGFLSYSFCAYFALIVKCDYPAAVITATIAIACREIFRNKQLLWLRIGDFSSSLIKIAIPGIIYSIVNQGSTFLSLQNIIAIISSAVAYHGLEIYFVATVIDLFDDETQKEYRTAFQKVNLFSLALIPLGILLVFALERNPWFMLVAVFPFYPLFWSYKYGIRTIAIANQEELIKTIKELQTSLSTTNEMNRELDADLNKKVDEQSILVEMGEALGTSLSLESTLEIVVSMIRKMAMYQSCVIFLIEKNNLIAAKSITPYRDILQYSELLKIEESIVSLVMRNKKPILIPDMQTMSEQRIFKDEKSVICIPLIVKNEIIGVIYIGANRPGSYNEDHLHLLSILGNAASNAIRSSQLYEQTEQKNTELQQQKSQLDAKIRSFEMLLSVYQKLSSSLNLEETQKIIIDGMEEMFQYESAAVFLVREKVLIPTKYRSPYGAILEKMQLSLVDQGHIMGWINHYRRPLILDDTRETKLKVILEKELSIMVVPMVVESVITGALYVGHSKPNYFNEEELRLLEAVAHTSAPIIKNAEIYEDIERKAITDGLTGLYTQRFFQERLTEEINHAKRRNVGLALVMIDADHFKSLNDTLGHPEGDKCLKTLADIFRKYTRDSDLVCRVGGDEFTILLKEITKKDAYVKVETIRRAVEQRFKDQPVKITASIGLACFPEDADNKKDLISAADVAVYKSKKQGRNKVNIATGPVGTNFKKEVLPRD